MFFFGCKTDPVQTNNCEIDSLSVFNAYKATHGYIEDSSNLKILELFTTKDSLFSHDTGEEVDTALSNRCLEKYVDLMDRFGIKDDTSPAQRDGKGRLTKGVRFQSKDLENWLKKVQSSGATEIRICLGRYNQDFLEAYFPPDSDDYNNRKNRLTVFLYPYQYVTSPSRVIVEKIVGSKAYDLGGLKP